MIILSYLTYLIIVSGLNMPTRSLWKMVSEIWEKKMNWIGTLFYCAPYKKIYTKLSLLLYSLINLIRILMMNISRKQAEKIDLINSIQLLKFNCKAGCHIVPNIFFDGIQWVDHFFFQSRVKTEYRFKLFMMWLYRQTKGKVFNMTWYFFNFEMLRNDFGDFYRRVYICIVYYIV